MAIQANITSPQGIPVTGAYCVISGYSYDAASNTLATTVEVYYSQAAYAAGSQPLQTKVYGTPVGAQTAQVVNVGTAQQPVPVTVPTTSAYTFPTMDASMPSGIQQEVYNWLMTLPDFSGGTVVA
jgi:hypothetical protein